MFEFCFAFVDCTGDDSWRIRESFGREKKNSTGFEIRNKESWVRQRLWINAVSRQEEWWWDLFETGKLVLS